MSNLYCTAPWNGITVRENGDVKTCCVGIEVLGNLNQNKIEDILKSSKLINIQNSLLTGDSDLKNCQGCKSSEQQTGLAALRQYYLKYYSNIQDTLQLRNLDIRWNNSCNLGCIYCTPMFSSTWQNRLNIQPSRTLNNYQDDLEKFIVKNSNQVQEIMLVGGEPMLMKQNAKLFSVLPNDTRISIITNISYDIEKLPHIKHLLDRPKENIVWSLSLENTEQQFEYVRNGADWHQVKKNLEFLNSNWPNTTSIIMVYSVLSAFDLPITLQTFRSSGIKKFTFQTYVGSPAFDVFCMPKQIKEHALEILTMALDQHTQSIHHADLDLYRIENADLIIKHLTDNTGSSNIVSKKEFYNRVSWCDQWNEVSYQQLWPHVVKLVDQHLQ